MNDENRTEGEASEASDWALYSRGPKDDTAGLVTELEMVRQLSIDELNRIRKASRDLRHLEVEWGWNRFLQNRALLENDVGEAIAAARVSSGTYNPHHLALIADSYKELLTELAKWVSLIEDSLSGEHEGLGELKTACALKRREATVYDSLLLTLNDVPTVQLVSDLDPHVAIPTAGSTNIPLRDIGDQLVRELQPLAALDVLQGRQKLERAMQQLLLLKVEAFRGRPCLLKPDQVGAGGQVEIEELPFERVDSTVRTIRISTAIARQLTVNDAEQSIRETENHEAPRQAPASPMATSPRPTADLDTSVDESGDNQGDVPLPVSDWIRLLDESLRLSEDLERTWSNALPAELEKSKSTGERLSAILAVLYRETNRQERLNRAAGVNNSIRRFPLDAQGVLELTDNSSETSSKGQSIATLYAFREVAHLIEGMGIPQDKNSTERRLWINGRFQQLRSLGTNLLGLLELDDASHEDWHAMLVAMRWNVSHGFTEGGIIYANLCVKQLGLAGLSHLLPLKGNELDALAMQLNSLATSLSSGEKIDQHQTWPVAYFWRDALDQAEFKWLTRRPEQT